MHPTTVTECDFVFCCCLYTMVLLLSWMLIMWVLSDFLDTLHWSLLWRQKQTGYWFQNGHRREDGRKFSAINWPRYVIVDSVLDLAGTEW